MTKTFRAVILALTLAVVLSACVPATPAAAPADTGAEPAAPAPAPAEPEPQPATLEDYFNAPRNETVLLDKPGRLEGADNWNPFVPGNATGWGLSQIGRDPLVHLSYGTGEFENWIAESLTPNEDASAWTLVIKKGVTWNDGTPFTVDDVVFSVELQMNVERLGAHFTYQEWIESVEKVDDFTMVFHLKKPNVRFVLDRFAGRTGGFDWIVPKHIWQDVEDPLTFKNYDPERGLPLSTGPYILYRITNNETVFVRNDNWWAYKTGFKPLPAPKKVVFTFVGPEEIRVATAIDNGFDGLEDITLSSFEALIGGNPNWIAFLPEMPYVWPDPCARTLSLNNAVEPWNDKDMRWVLNYVMDRPQIIDVAYEGTSVMGPYIWPAYPAMQPYTDLVPEEVLAQFYEPNLAKAEEILLAKGYTKTGDYWEKDGQELGLEIQVHEAFTELEKIADVYVEQLQRFGINGVKVKLTAATWDDNRSFGQFEAQSGWQTCGSIMEPYSSLLTMAGDPAPIGERPAQGQNAYRWYNERYTEIVTEMGTLFWDDPRLMELTAEALAIYHEELPVLPMAQAKKLVPFNTTYWTGWPTNEDYYQVPCIWWYALTEILTRLEPVQ